MTGKPRDIDWPTRRWLLWGLGAILVVVAIGLFFVFLGNEENAAEETSPTLEATNQMEWSIVLTDLTGDEVTLKGDLPDGFPTETWQNDFMVARSVGESFEWDVDQELPVRVVEIDEAADCAALNSILTDIVSAANEAPEPGLWQARAFAQHALNTMSSQNCEIDENDFAGI